MGINTEKDIEANLQIGPTDQGMVRIFVTAGDAEIPMDFEIDEAKFNYNTNVYNSYINNTCKSILWLHAFGGCFFIYII
mgnify:CR=1 FL=1